MVIKRTVKRTDWEAIEKLYRAGQMSNRAIASEYGITEGGIRKKARQEAWTKDLSDTVRAAVRGELVRTEVRNTNATDREIIEQAAATGAQVVRTHRRDIRTAAELAASMMEELKEEGLELPRRASILRDLSVVHKNLITLERQAYNLDETSAEESYEDRLARLMKKA